MMYNISKVKDMTTSQITVSNIIYKQAKDLADANDFESVSDYVENILIKSLKKEMEMSKLQKAISLGVDSNYLNLDEKYFFRF
jgi:hypothetical protein